MALRKRRGYPSRRKLYDKDSRTKKGRKIMAVLRDFLGADVGALRCLEIGCSIGIISDLLVDQIGFASIMPFDLRLWRGLRRREAWASMVP